jgi:hypothetical protein
VQRAFCKRSQPSAERGILHVWSRGPHDAAIEPVTCNLWVRIATWLLSCVAMKHSIGAGGADVSCACCLLVPGVARG